MRDDEFFYMEDAVIGQKFFAGPLAVTAEAIIAYARAFDPQPFHLDAAAAKDSLFGELVASGWHTASLTMRLIVESSPRMKGGMIGRSVETMNWPRPVRPGDALSYESEIMDIRASTRLPDRGILRMKGTTRNQHGETVLEMTSTVFVPRRKAS